MSKSVLILSCILLFFTAITFGENCNTKFQSNDFDEYLLQLSWAKTFCSTKPNSPQCQMIEHGVEIDDEELEWAASHPTLHGLWPQYSQGGYPYFCEEYNSCCRGKSCQLLQQDSNFKKALKQIKNNQEWEKYGPGFFAGDNFLATHEWPKHGSCTNMGPVEYFATSLETVKRVENSSGGFNLLFSNLGKSVPTAELYESLEKEGRVAVRCNRGSGELKDISFCFKKGDDGKPAERVDCDSHMDTCRNREEVYIPAYEASGPSYQTENENNENEEEEL
eukprot:c6799_g1_i1.p1 GENE.c6799_g1_i1~~c6799_g1_i1.p1  ORF type:complete len:278 (+),score=101.17 c6799_g1_i1:41-874(+)